MRTILICLILASCFCTTTAQQILFHEDFNPPSGADSILNSNNWYLNNALFPSTVFYHSQVVASQTNKFGTPILEVPDLSNSWLLLSFDHICKIDVFDLGNIELSLYDVAGNLINTIPQLPLFIYMGNGAYANFTAFNSSCYSTWKPAMSATIPQNTWWKQEVFKLNYNNIIFNPAYYFSIQFALVDDFPPGPSNNYGWIVDNIQIRTETITSIDQMQNDVYTITPNPTHDYVKMDQVYADIQIVDLQGRQITRLYSASEINLESIPAGLYLLYLNDKPAIKLMIR